MDALGKALHEFVDDIQTPKTTSTHTGPNDDMRKLYQKVKSKVNVKV